MSDVEDRVRRQLAEMAAGVQPDPVAPRELVNRVRRSRRRRAGLVSSGVAVALAAVVLSAVVAAGNRSGAPAVVAGPDGLGPVLSDPGPATFVMTDLPASPLSPREDMTGVWTGEELIIWGGTSNGAVTGDGAAYVPRTGTWHRIAASPLSPRTRQMAVWTGREMIVWGGSEERGGVGGLLDGAAYDPTTDTWRRISDSPPGSDRTSAATAAVAGQAVFAGGGSPTDSRSASVLVYDPATDAWSEHTAHDGIGAIAAFGGRVAIATVDPSLPRDLRVEMIDPITGRIDPLPDFPIDDPGGLIASVGMAASDTEVFAAATVTDPGGNQSTTVGALPIGSSEWSGVTTLDGDEFSPGTQPSFIYPPGLTAWTGTWLIGWSRSPTAIAPGTERTIDRIDEESVPCGTAGVAVWTGNQILQWGGQNCRREGPSSQVDTGVAIRIEPTD